jgi:hypothetical protein
MDIKHPVPKSSIVEYKGKNNVKMLIMDHFSLNESFVFSALNVK